jgi:hypothetical protein
MDLEEAEDAAATGNAIKVAAASVDKAAFERDCEKWRKVVRKNREEGDSDGLLRCAGCTKNKTFTTLQALMHHARDTKKHSQLEHSAYLFALGEVEMDMGCEKEQDPGLPAESGRQLAGLDGLTGHGSENQSTRVQDDSCSRPERVENGKRQREGVTTEPSAKRLRLDGVKESLGKNLLQEKEGMCMGLSKNAKRKRKRLEAACAVPPQGSDCPAHDSNEGQLERVIEVGGGPSLPLVLASSKGAEDDSLRQIKAIPNPNMSVDDIGVEAVKEKEPRRPTEPSSCAVSGPTEFDDAVRDFRRSLSEDIRKLGTVQPDQLFCCRVCRVPTAYLGLNSLRQHAGTVRQLPWRHAALCAAIVQVIEEMAEEVLEKGETRDPQSLVEAALRKGLGPRVEQEEVIGKAELDNMKGGQQTEQSLGQDREENTERKELTEKAEAGGSDRKGGNKDEQRPKNGADGVERKAKRRGFGGDGQAGSGQTDAEWGGGEIREGQRSHKGEEVPECKREKDVAFGETQEGLCEGTRRDQKEDELEDGEIRDSEALKVGTPDKAAESKEDDGPAETEPTEASDAGRNERDRKGVTEQNQKNGGAERDCEEKQGRNEGGVDSPSSRKRGGPSTSAGAELQGDQEQSWVVQRKENLPMGASKKRNVSFSSYDNQYCVEVGPATHGASVVARGRVSSFSICSKSEC